MMDVLSLVAVCAAVFVLLKVVLPKLGISP